MDVMSRQAVSGSMLVILVFITLFVISLSLLRRNSYPPRVSVQLITPLPAPRVLDSDTKLLPPGLQHLSDQYVSYLPHSGFHNQRIALENALVISYILNRTLLVPPIILGDPPPRYYPSSNLPLYISSKPGFEHCTAVSGGVNISSECRQHVHIPWQWLIDLQHLTRQHRVKMLMRWDLTDTFFVRRLHLQLSETYFLADNSKYQYRFYDSQTDNHPLGTRFKTRIDLPVLAALTHGHRLLQFGSLFGTTRVRLSDPAHVALREDVRRAMAFTNPDLLAVANSIRDSKELGGDSKYAAVHVRLGNGGFAKEEASARNTRVIWWRLVRELGMSDEDALEIELRLWEGRKGLPPPDLPQSHDVAASHLPHSPLPSLDDISTCQRKVSPPLLKIPLYIATDTFNHPELSIFTRTFPCVYFLANFSMHTSKLDTLSLSSTGGGREPAIINSSLSSTIPLSPFLLPFLDAMIVSKGRVVIGTEGSTFSQFVEDVLWHVYHGWDIPAGRS